jgi:hypothetical protein
MQIGRRAKGRANSLAVNLTKLPADLRMSGYIRLQPNLDKTRKTKQSSASRDHDRVVQRDRHVQVLYQNII